MELNEGTIAKTWPKLLGRVLHIGQVVDIDGYGKTLELDEPILIRISHPLENRFCEESGWNKTALEEYYQQTVIPANPYGFDYTYSMRFRANMGIDQLEECMNVLDKNQTSRRAIACTWKPREDYNELSHPCQILQQRVIRDGKLNLTSYFRSHDAVSAWPANLYMLSRWIEDDSLHLGVLPGCVYCISNTLHIYQRDIRWAARIAKDEMFGEQILKSMELM
jgi:thymidylate synthase (methanogen type)